MGKALRPDLWGEDSGGCGDAGADTGLEVAAHAGLDRGRAAVGLEALELEPKPFGTLPEVGIVDVTAIPVERVDHLKEASLQAGGLGGGVQGGRARVLAGDREVAEDDRRRARADLQPGRGAVRAAEIGVDDQLGAGAAPVVVRAGGRDRGAGQLGRQESASKIRLAPGISSGVGDS